MIPSADDVDGLNSLGSSQLYNRQTHHAVGTVLDNDVTYKVVRDASKEENNFSTHLPSS